MTQEGANRNRHPRTNWYDWDSEVFVADCKLEDNVLHEEGQEICCKLVKKKCSLLRFFLLRLRLFRDS